MQFSLPVQIYYEDTDHSGLVYHANYLKYFERAREHILGVSELLKLAKEGIGFAVYELSMKYKKGAYFGDCLDIRSSVTLGSAYRLSFIHQAFRKDELLVNCQLELVCISTHDHKLSPIHPTLVTRFTQV